MTLKFFDDGTGKSYTAMGVPVQLTTSNVTSNSANLTLPTAVTGAQYYELSESTNGGSTWTVVDSAIAPSSIVSPATYSRSGLTSGATYQWRLRAKFASLVSPLYSAIHSVVIANSGTTVTRVDTPLAGIFAAGFHLDFVCRMSDLLVTPDLTGGVPFIYITVNGVQKQAAYYDQPRLDWLRFRYTIQSGDTSSGAAVVVSGSQIQLNGGVINDINASAILPALNSIGSTSGLFVDPSAPTTPGKLWSYTDYPDWVYTESGSEIRFVDGTNGNDSTGDGLSWATAWKTFTHSLPALIADTGARILLFQGAFAEAGTVDLQGLANRGTPAAPMIVCANPSSTATFNYVSDGFKFNDQQHWIFNGKNVTTASSSDTSNTWSFVGASGAQATTGSDTHHITIRGLKGSMNGPGGSASNEGFVYFDGLNYMGAIDCDITGPGWEEAGINANTACFYMTKCPHMILENCKADIAPRPIYLKHPQDRNLTEDQTQIIIRNNYVPFSGKKTSRINVSSWWAWIENNIFGLMLEIAATGGVMSGSSYAASHNTIVHNTLVSLEYTPTDGITYPDYNYNRYNIITDHVTIYQYDANTTEHNKEDYNAYATAALFKYESTSTINLTQFQALNPPIQEQDSASWSLNFAGGTDPTTFTAPTNFAVAANASGQYDFGNGIHAGSITGEVGVGA